MNNKQILQIANDYGYISRDNALKVLNVAKYGRLKCEICERNMSKYNIDHIIPKSKGGSSDIGNLRLTHEKCNRLRSNKFTIKDLICLLF